MGNLARVAEQARHGAKYAAAALLALVTLAVFYVLQDYGPESAIRRFHRAAQNGDVRELQRVTAEPVTNPAVGEMYNWVRRMQRIGGRYRLARVERQPTRVYAALVYEIPNGEQYATVWVVVKPRGSTLWQVAATDTRTILRRGLVGVPTN